MTHSCNSHSTVQTRIDWSAAVVTSYSLWTVRQRKSEVSLQSEALADHRFQHDFYLFNTFAPNVLQKLLKHHEELTGIEPLTRGRQFNWFTPGQMIGIGPRVACSGGDGDALRLYEGMEAATEAGLNALFNHAEVRISFRGRGQASN
jgi:hypothetical protein